LVSSFHGIRTPGHMQKAISRPWTTLTAVMLHCEYQQSLFLCGRRGTQKDGKRFQSLFSDSSCFGNVYYESLEMASHPGRIGSRSLGGYIIVFLFELLSVSILNYLVTFSDIDGPMRIWASGSSSGKDIWVIETFGNQFIVPFAGYLTATYATLTTNGPACRHWDLISCRIGLSCRDFTAEKSRCGSRRVGLSPATWRSSADLVASAGD